MQLADHGPGSYRGEENEVGEQFNLCTIHTLDTQRTLSPFPKGEKKNTKVSNQGLLQAQIQDLC